MKKISVTIWVILGCVFLYTASLWQRPLFISEFNGGARAIEALYSGSAVPLREMPLYCIFSCFGINPFTFRILSALLALLSAGALFAAGRKCLLENVSKAGALIFLLTPAIFLSGTASPSLMYGGAPVVIGFFLLFLASESSSWKKAVAPGAGAAFFLALAPILQGSAAGFLLTAVAWVLYSVISLIAGTGENKAKQLYRYVLGLLLFLPGLVYILTSDSKLLFILPGLQDVKNLAAFAVAGSFPWILFLLPLFRNFTSRALFMLREPFLRSGIVLAAVSFAASLFTTVDAGFFTPFLAGAAIVLAAGMELEQSENGFRSANIVLCILTLLFFLAAAVTGAWAALGLYTQWLKPVWKLFSARDSWILTAAVPAVAAVWCLTAMGEKLRKEPKFLSFCAGTAFLLLAFHGLTPLKVIEYNAPGNFIKKVVLPRTTSKTLYFGDEKMVPPLQSVVKESAVSSFSLSDMAEIKKNVKEGKKMCFVTLSRQLSEKLPFPKTTLRSGNFIAVFYNIDFPEMRVRKP